jgi:hypothetical protein
LLRITTYYFTIRATNAGGESPDSNEASATPQVPAPGAPNLLTAEAGNATVTLTWAPVGGSTGYKIYQRLSSDAYETETATDPYTNGAWTNESVTVSVYAEAGLSGMTSLTYSLDSATPQAYINEDPIIVSEEGQHTLQFHITDVAGNTLTLSLAVNIDLTDPSVSFVTNGNETWSQSASTTVTVTDTGSGVETASLEYAWSNDTATPTTGWEFFTNGDTLTKDGVSGDWYLHIQAQDAAGNTTNIVSNRFRLRKAASQEPAPLSPIAVIDVNGITLDTANIDTSKPSFTLEVTPKDGTAYVSLPAGLMTEFAGKNETFMIEIKTPFGSYHIPVNLAALIPGLTEILAAHNLKAEDISFKITLTDKSGDKDIQAAFANSLPNGNVLGAIVDFYIEIINTKSGQTIATADTFSQALTRVIPLPKEVTVMPALWGAFRYNELTKKFEFVPAKLEQLDGVWYVMIRSYSNSVYAVVANPVSFVDVQKHWGLTFIQLAASKGLVEGVGGGKYAPDRSVTRAEFTAMLVRSLGRGTTTSSGSVTPYDDVQQGAWYYGEVSNAKDLGLLSFVSGKSFKPNQPLTREEMSSMLAAAIKLEKLSMPKDMVSLDSYKDYGSISPTFMEDLRLIVTLQIMKGTSESTVDPKGETTRA